ncbi:cytochrome P450 [Mycobacterium sherrisii]|uniref:cytochrome P450 n=1 Tax=Mycobacterium sherrisii TaxID=243061 RepID=UPI003974AF18
MTQATSACPFGTGFDFTDPDVMVKGRPVEQFAWLRRSAPVWWNQQPPERSGGFRDGGYWVVSKHKHVLEVSTDRDGVWSSHAKGSNIRYDDDIAPEEMELTKDNLLIDQDAPHHTRLRKLVSRLFTPRAVGALRPGLQAAAQRIAAQAAADGAGDFVADIAAELPLVAIADLLGVPQEDRHKLFEWTNAMMSFDNADTATDARTAYAEVLGYSYQLAEQRKRCPADDIVTLLVNAEVDGDTLSELEFGWFVILLAVAGNETTRNATTWGMHAFLENADQWELFKRHRPATMANEVVRWSTPVNVFQRTALRDVELGGAQIKAGQRVGLFYGSANFDDEVFDDPFRFDILRDPNPQLGFGGHGAHYCIGANLARMNIELIFNAIADHIPHITELAPPVRQRSSWLNAATQYRVNYGRCT